MAQVGAPCGMLAQRSARGRSQPAQGYPGTLAHHSRTLTDPCSRCSSASPWKLRDAKSGPLQGMEAGSRTGRGEELTRSRQKNDTSTQVSMG